jgi:hypothetical protein
MNLDHNVLKRPSAAMSTPNRRATMALTARRVAAELGDGPTESPSRSITTYLECG